MLVLDCAMGISHLFYQTEGTVTAASAPVQVH
jgi:hypothetical protein